MHPNAEMAQGISTSGVAEHPNAWYDYNECNYCFEQSTFLFFFVVVVIVIVVVLSSST